VSKIDEKCVFCIANSAVGPVLTIGVPQAAWEYMKDGKTHNFDLTSIGFPIKLILFGAESHDAAMRTLEQAAKQQGVAILDERRRDFDIKPPRKN